MANCYETNFPVSPVTPSPVYTTDPAEITAFTTKAEQLWNWIIGIFNGDVTDKGTFKHFLKELENNCGLIKSLPDWLTSKKPYSKGSIVKDSNGSPWLSVGDNNNNEPKLETVLTDNWSLMGDLRKVAIMDCFTIDVSTSAELQAACSYASHKNLLCSLTINCTSGSYTTSNLFVAGTNDSRFFVIIEGNGATINSTSARILQVLHSSVHLRNLTFKGNGSNEGIFSNGGDINTLKNTITVRDCRLGINMTGDGQYFGEGTRFTQNKYACEATNGGVVYCENSTVSSTVSSSMGFRAIYGGVVRAKGSSITTKSIGGYARNLGVVDLDSSTITGQSFTGVYVRDRGQVFVKSATIKNSGYYNMYCIGASHAVANGATLQNSSDSAVYCYTGSVADAEKATGNGNFKVFKGSKIMSANTSGFSYNISRDTWHKNGSIYNG